MSKAEAEPRRVCEEYLRGKIRWNTDHHCSPRESAVAQRMLANGDALERFYAEIYPALNRDGIAWKHAIDASLYAATYWRSQDIAKCRAGREELEELRAQISRQAAGLADLFERRDELYNHSGFGADTHYSILEVIDEAAECNGHYQGWVREPLQKLGRFDLKYWPTLSECLRVIGTNAGQAQIEPNNRLTGAATNSSRPSKADSVRALLESFNNHRGSSLGHIPPSFEFTSSALADLVNVLFEIPPDSPVTEEYVKTERHRAKRGAWRPPAKGKTRHRA